MSIVVVYAGAGGAVSENYLGLVNNVLSECGEREVDDLSSPSVLTKLTMKFLNFTVEDIYNESRWYFREATVTWAPVAEQATYNLPTTFDLVASPPRYKGGQLTYITPEKLDQNFPDRSTSGTPQYWTIWGEDLELYPTPSSDFISDDVVEGTDSNFYVCIKDHTSTTDDKPITGANYATYWLQDTALSAGGTWAESTAYEDKRLIMRFYRRPTAMSAADDDPDIPEKFMEILKVGARSKLKRHLEAPDWKADYQDYRTMLRKMVTRRNQTGHKQVRYLR